MDGWAVTIDGEIQIRTVSDTRRAALVNYLYLNVHPILASASDGEIEKLWQAIRTNRSAEVVEIRVHKRGNDGQSIH